jgi:RNA polymerase sigma factor (sigma-70 family)
MPKTKTTKALIPEQHVDFNHELTKGFAASYIRRKARRLAQQPGFSRSDEEDLRQQLCVRVLERLPQFDPAQGCFNAFVKLIVNQYAANCRRYQGAQMRNRSGDTSLNVLVEGEEGALELAQTIGRRELNARLRRDERPAEDALDLGQDVSSFLSTLPPRLRQVAERLKERSPSEIAKGLGVHRSTVYLDIRRLRTLFAQAGFHDYLRTIRHSADQAGSYPNSDSSNDRNYPVESTAMHCCPAPSCDCPPTAKPPQTAEVNFIVREPAEVYHAKTGEYLTSHLLADFRKCPLLYHRKREGLIRSSGDCPAYLVGRAAHTVILEGDDAFHQQYAVGGPVNPQTGLPYGSGTKAWNEWAKEQGKDVLTDQQHALITSMAASVKRHAEAQQLLRQGIAEGVIRNAYCNVNCQIRMDWFDPHLGIADLKTCDDLTWFEADARRYGYVHQLAFYRAVLAQVIGLYVPVHLIAVEKKEPFRCGVWRLSPEVLASAQCENEQAIDRLKNCAESGSWPTGYEEPRLFDYL